MIERTEPVLAFTMSVHDDKKLVGEHRFYQRPSGTIGEACHFSDS